MMRASRDHISARESPESGCSQRTGKAAGVWSAISRAAVLRCRPQSDATIDVYRSVLGGIVALAAIGIITASDAGDDGAGARLVTEGQKMTVVDQIQGIEETQNATVILMPPDWFFLTSVTEAALRAGGCTYSTNDSSRIRSLIDILKHGDLSIVEPTEMGWMGEPREGVALELPGGEKIAFLFTINFINDGVRGYFYRLAHFNGPAHMAPEPTARSYLTAKPSLPNELAIWGVRTGASPITNDVRYDNADMKRRACDYFTTFAEKLK